MKTKKVLKYMYFISLPLLIWLCIWNYLELNEWIDTHDFTSGEFIIRSFNYTKAIMWNIISLAYVTFIAAGFMLIDSLKLN